MDDKGGANIKLVEDKPKLHDELSEYLDIIENLLTFAQELQSPKQREALLEIVDQMIGNYKNLYSKVEKLWEAEEKKWPKIRLP